MSLFPLKRGDRVGVVASGFAVRLDSLDAGLAKMRRLGFVPVEGASVRSREGYFAGDDEARLADLQAVLDDETFRAVWCARGGYGTARLLDRLDLRPLIRRPKPLIGYSDATALFSAILKRSRTVCLHGPMVINLATPASYHAASLAAMLRGRPVRWRIPARGVLAAGRASGRLIGGNLTVFTNLLGTAHMPDLRGAIVFLEETGEEAYRLDRLLQHLKMSGVLKRVGAVVIGQMLVPGTARDFPPDRDVSEVLRDQLLPLGVPVVTGFPSGHGEGKWTIPIGGMATVDTAAARVTLSPRPAPLPRARS